MWQTVPRPRHGGVIISAAVLAAWVQTCAAHPLYPHGMRTDPFAAKVLPDAGAVEEAEARVAQRPTSAYASFGLVYAYLEAGRVDEAEKEIARAADQTTADPSSLRVLRAEVLQSRGHFEPAVAELEAAAQEAPSASDAARYWAYAGDLTVYAFNPADAARCYLNALDLYLGAAAAFAELRGVTRVAACCPDEDRVAWLAIGLGFASSTGEGQDLALALSALKAVEPQCQDNSVYYRVLSMVYSRLDMDAEALQAAQTGAQLAPESPSAHAFYAARLGGEAHREEAIAEWQRVIETAGSLTGVADGAYRELAELYKWSGRVAEAYDALKLAAPRSPGKDYLVRMVKCALAAGRAADALAFLQAHPLQLGDDWHYDGEPLLLEAAVAASAGDAATFAARLQETLDLEDIAPPTDWIGDLRRGMLRELVGAPLSAAAACLAGYYLRESPYYAEAARQLDACVAEAPGLQSARLLQEMVAGH
jgi:tetratricopeptide (TPR) repeat protein